MQRAKRHNGLKVGRRLGLTVAQEERLRAELRLTTPSEPWIDVQVVEVVQLDANGDVTVRRKHDRRAFPPGGKQTKMEPCACCGILNPPIAMENGNCLDHREDGIWGRSPSAMAIRVLEYRHMRRPCVDLCPESEAALREEIERYRRTSFVSHAD